MSLSAVFDYVKLAIMDLDAIIDVARTGTQRMSYGAFWFGMAMFGALLFWLLFSAGLI